MNVNRKGLLTINSKAYISRKMAARIHRRDFLNNPQSGHYLISISPKGWKVPARVTIEDDVIRLVINGSQVIDRWYVNELGNLLADATMAGTLFDHPLFRVVLFGEPCDETTYRHRLALRDWAVDNAPWHPCLHPDKPIDPRTLPATDF